MTNYKDIRFLESTSNLREILSCNSGRELSLERANQIAVCLEQGRLYFESAANVEWEIKPLLVYYGMVGFAKAITLARNLAKLESLPQKHGVTDISTDFSVDTLTAKIETDGTFQGLNDACCELEGLLFHGANNSKQRIAKPTAQSASIAGKEIALNEILARIPGLESLYYKTFNDDPSTTPCSHFGYSRDYDEEGMIDFAIRPFLPFTDLDTLRLSVADLRQRFPFLENWRVAYAAPGLELKFANLMIDSASEFSRLEFRTDAFYQEPERVMTEGDGEVTLSPRLKFEAKDLANYCQPVRGKLTPEIETTYLIKEWNGIFLSEISLYYLGMYLLSSLVRYRPHLWANAIARRSFRDKAPDDRSLVLIEEFVDQALTVFPPATVIAINEPFA